MPVVLLLAVRVWKVDEAGEAIALRRPMKEACRSRRSLVRSVPSSFSPPSSSVSQVGVRFRGDGAASLSDGPRANCTLLLPTGVTEPELRGCGRLLTVPFGDCSLEWICGLSDRWTRSKKPEGASNVVDSKGVSTRSVAAGSWAVAVAMFKRERYLCNLVWQERTACWALSRSPA
jgi:hypothetical protein